MGNVECLENKTDGFYTFVDITSEQIHAVLNQLYTIVTSKASFDQRKMEIEKLHDKYLPLYNHYTPHLFQFVRDCYGIEYFIFIATVGYYAIDMVMYYDLKEWVVLNTGMPFRTYITGGFSKLHNSVSKRSPPINSDDIVMYNSRKQFVDSIDLTNKYDYGPDVVYDYRSIPKIKILEPPDNSIVPSEFRLVVDVIRWKLGKRYYRVLINDKEYMIVNSSKDQVIIKLHKPGHNKITVQLVDPAGRFNDIKDEIHVMYNLADEVSTNEYDECMIHNNQPIESDTDSMKSFTPSYTTESVYDHRHHKRY